MTKRFGYNYKKIVRTFAFVFNKNNRTDIQIRQDNVIKRALTVLEEKVNRSHLRPLRHLLTLFSNTMN